MRRLLSPLAFFGLGLSLALAPPRARADDTGDAGEAVATKDIKDPQELYHLKCAGCHGEDGKGQTKWGKKYKAPDFTSAKFQGESKDSEFLETIQKGVIKKVKDDKGQLAPKKIMPGWSEKLSDDQMNGLVAYVRKFKQP
jgi:mono/diheme cytochrome c family protein